MTTASTRPEAIPTAFEAGRRAGLAVAALAVGLISFLSLLGMEKAGLAIILGILALRGPGAGATTRKLALTGIGLGALFLVSAAILLALYWDRLVRVLAEVQKLS